MKRILVALPNWFGDALFATPFLALLRERYPRALIAALGVGRAQEILQGNPAVDALIRLDRPEAHAALRGWRLWKRLRDGRFDTAVLLRRSLSRTALIAAAGIPRRIGHDNAKSGWLLTDRVPMLSGPVHRAGTYLALLRALDPEPASHPARPPVYQYYPVAEERTQAAALLTESGLRPDEPFIALHPGANWEHKRWPAARFAELGDTLQARLGLRVVMTGTGSDQPLLQPLASRMRQPPILLAGRTTLRQAAAVLERARLVVSNDTGMVHLASAMGRPVVALYGPTSPALTGPLGPAERTVVIHHPGCCPCVPCYQPHHPGFPGMESISVEEVHEAAKKLLNG